MFIYVFECVRLTINDQMCLSPETIHGAYTAIYLEVFFGVFLEVESHQD